MIEQTGHARLRRPFPKKDRWSTPFAEAPLHLLGLLPGASILAGPLFPHHPPLRGRFPDDAFDGFEDRNLAEEAMNSVSEDRSSFTPPIAQRSVLSG
ncbi:MAG TPA: hypothetical protein VFA47_06650 [Candidatus Manganitrophaceae bacterium]|nr:hypothetical protein [Candidatus Manganitrophaceae bacterium]